MNKKQLKDILATHADELLHGHHPKADDYPELSLADKHELAPLLDVAERVQSTLRPIRPPRRFESKLKKELLTTAHLHQTQGYVPPNPGRDLLVLAAIIGFFVSLAGVLLAWRLRRRWAQPLIPAQQ
ncbi:MAG: hypothetical protein JW953_02000 [Anaerolineae bacterium]|nr:hypothetical protein [Anaerolineae bacterium]